jgi:hypothetical protein
MHYCYEKAGLNVFDQPIPWNAESVVVQARVRPTSRPLHKRDFRLVTQAGEFPAELAEPTEHGQPVHVLFRLPPIDAPLSAALHWRQTRLATLELPFLSEHQFLDSLRIEHPTFAVRIGDQLVSCQTFVASQCRGMTLHGLLTSATSLAPLADLGVEIELRNEQTGEVQHLRATLGGTQLIECRALVGVAPAKIPRRKGAWTATWKVGSTVLATHRTRAIAQAEFTRSLHVAETRFAFQDAAGQLRVLRKVPAEKTSWARFGPCFVVHSMEPGMAGTCRLHIAAHLRGQSRLECVHDQEFLVTDGPTMIAPGTIPVEKLESLQAFELFHKSRSLGILPVDPIPSATFNGEGGFRPPIDFPWSDVADEELNERLAKLLQD